MDPIKTINLQQATADKTLNIWVGSGNDLKRVSSSLDGFIIFYHTQGTGPADWAMTAQSNVDVPMLKGLIESLQSYCNTQEATANAMAAARQAQAPARTTVEKKIPLPPGTTKEQAQELAAKIKSELGLRPGAAPKAGDTPL